MLKTHASILSEVPVDPSTSNDLDAEVAGMPCMEKADRDDESDDDIDVIE